MVYSTAVMPTGSTRVPPNRTPVRIPHYRGREKETEEEQEEGEDEDEEKEEETTKERSVKKGDRKRRGGREKKKKRKGKKKARVSCEKETSKIGERRDKGKRYVA